MVLVDEDRADCHGLKARLEVAAKSAGFATKSEPQAGQSKRLLVEMRNDDHKKAQATFLLPALTLNARKLLQGIAGSKVWVSSPDKLVPTSLKATPFHRSNRT